MSFRSNLAYEASAGSGKTFMLVVRYISLLLRGADASKIVALTFTNKAASEMQERIAMTLEDLQNRDELSEIVKQSGLSRDEVLSRKAKLLEHFLSRDLKITTIDSFFALILRRFSLYASLRSDFETFSSQHEHRLRERFLALVRSNGKSSELLRLALESGRRFNDLNQLLNDLFVNSITKRKYSYRDTKEYERTALEAFGELREMILACKEASSTARGGMSGESLEDLLSKSWLSRDTLNYSTFKKCYKSEMDEKLCTIRSSLKSYFDAYESSFFYALFELVEIYKDAKRELYESDGELGFDDVSYLVHKILHLIDDSDFLYFRLDARIEHILLDEFQDTSLLQYAILEPLISEITASEDGRSFFFVGDKKQSIYRFRGGFSRLFDEVLKRQGTTLEHLSINYRSSRLLVEFANEVFGEKMRDFTPQSSHKSEDGFVEVRIVEDPLSEIVGVVEMLRSAGSSEIALLCATNSDAEVLEDLLRSKMIDVSSLASSKLINQRGVKAVLEYFKYLYFTQDLYLQNFLFLAGTKEHRSLDLGGKTLLQMAKRIADSYSLWSEDLLLFMDILASFDDMESLLFSYERIEASSPSRTHSEVAILTVHKSKGLEFESVVVVDRLKRANADRSTIVYDYEGIDLVGMKLRQKGRDKVDEEYNSLLGRSKALRDEDALNAQYVAFTRAKSALVVLQKSKNSSFEDLDLKELKVGELSFSRSKKIAPAKSVDLEFEQIFYGKQDEILKSSSSSEGTNFGLALHYMLEMLDGFSASSFEMAFSAMRNRYALLIGEDGCSDVASRVGRLLECGEFRSLLSGEVYKEKPIKYRGDLKVLDLLIFDGKCYKVVDFKSSKSFHNEHIKQVNGYMEALRQMQPDAVEGYLCYLLKDGVEIERV